MRSMCVTVGVPKAVIMLGFMRTLEPSCTQRLMPPMASNARLTASILSLPCPTPTLAFVGTSIIRASTLKIVRNKRAVVKHISYDTLSRMWDEKRSELFARLDELNRRRTPAEIRRIEGKRALCADGRWRVVFCSNDYLGLKSHPKLAQAAKKAADVWGTGSGASRLITGTLGIHAELEERICEWLGCEAALLFGSGYLASVGTIEALGSIAKTILSDRLNHASIIDGCRLARSEVRIYEHADIEQLSALLGASDAPALVVTESVFSMEGDHPNLEELSKTVGDLKALLMIDEAHALGVYGDRGRGLCADLSR
ncbi:MAG TPA: aminotransferase class I/II-fold pyridoxal phosphate-dependent enzyme, partial [Proteobacteria bacterium]|nr:aminotransferase class I/II-fold pyridoxal phosphate-dependent enzyme [Pseudomonadota bacterium]